MWYAKVVYETFDFFGGFDSSWLLLGLKIGPSTILLARTRIGRSSSHGSAARLPPTPRHVMSASALGEVFTDIPH